MATLQMDLPSATRFVSSLSKSLQALCHGCMDFDTEIEIVGYINVNIDCGSKVDYVLNERVSKGSNNSMKFISNSFLAKKDDPKASSDRSCSPIPELNRNTQQNRRASSYNDSQHYKSSGIYSPHSQVLRGSQKRSWSSGGWRSAPRKSSKSARSQYESQSYDSYAQNESSFNSQQNTSSPFPMPSTSQQEYDTSQAQSQEQIKTETGDENQPSEEYPNEGSFSLPGDVNIKSEPDSSGLLASSTDPSATNHPNTDAGNSMEGSAQETFFKPELGESMNSEGQDSGQYNEEQDSNANPSEGTSESGSHYPATHDQVLFPEEESGDGQQFDVIEIDDEDEDFAEFAGQDQNQPNMYPYGNSGGSMMTSTYDATSAGIHQASGHSDYWYSSPHIISCTMCPEKFETKILYQQHLSVAHRDQMPYHCTVCPKVYFTQSGWKRHEMDHAEPKYNCQICDVKCSRNYNLLQHIRSVHKLMPCPNCPELSRTKEDFNYHILRCDKKKKKSRGAMNMKTPSAGGGADANY